MATDLTRPDPTPILDLLEAFRRSKTMFVAVSLGVFDALQTGPQTASDLATRLGAHPDALGRLLDACVCLGLLQRNDDRYENTPEASVYLTSDSPDRLTGYIQFSDRVMWKLWEHLETAVRDGTHSWKPAFGWEGPIFENIFKTDESRREFSMGMHGFGVISSPVVVSAFDLSRFRTLVDLGGATGHLAVAACQRYAGLNAIVFDLPDVIDLAEECVRRSAVAERIRFQRGDFFEDELPEADLFALGRILHDWTDAKCIALLRRIQERLPVGGAVLLAEKLLTEDGNGPRWARMQDLNMLTITEGRERTLSEYEQLLHTAGFGDVFGIRTNAPLDAVLAVKANEARR